MNQELVGRDIPHYYGNYVRLCFIAVALISLFAIPFIGFIMPFGVVPEIIGALLLILLAGLTNPHGKLLILLDVIVSALGVFILELEAIVFYSSSGWVLFAVREMATILLVFAFYYSVKTIRAVWLGKIGKPDRLWEFEEDRKN